MVVEVGVKFPVPCPFRYLHQGVLCFEGRGWVKRGWLIIKIEWVGDKLIIIRHDIFFRIKMYLKEVEDSIKKYQNSLWGVDKSFLV